MARKSRIQKIGVTGGIGSGKSEVCRIFERLGIPVLYADDIAKELSNSDPRIKEALRHLLGDKTFTSDGMLDRAFIASRIFTNKSLQKKINAIVHPRVEEVIAQKIAELEETGKPIAIVEAALIYEAGLDKILDAVIVIDADKESKIARVMKRDGISRESVLSRMKSQMNPSSKLNKADYSILNNGTKMELEQKVLFLNSIFQNLARINS